MRVLDLFAGAGLVAEGLIRAGLVPTGVDIEPQPHYPGEFIQADVTALDDAFLARFDFIWASPPCLRDTALRSAPGAKGLSHPDLITPTRAKLRRSGRPYAIENVETAELIDPIILCGSHFGLGVTVDGLRYHLERHRKIETNWPLAQPVCAHLKPVVGVYGGHARCRAKSAGGRGTADFVGHSHNEIMTAAMGCRSGLTTAELSQGIPPAYSEHVARAWLALAAREGLAA